jgi:membrane protein DedA with SNARE-associated domain
VEDLIARYGLVGIFVGAAFEGDVTLILAGVTAALGLLNLPLALAVGVIGAVLGDTLWYVAGRWRSTAIRGSRLYQRAGPAVERLVGRVGPWQIVIARFLYGTRGPTMLFWGTQHLSLGRFWFYDLVGCGLWAVILGTLGYAGSRTAKTLMGEVVRAEVWLLAVALSVLGAGVAFRYAHYRWREQRSNNR